MNLDSTSKLLIPTAIILLVAAIAFPYLDMPMWTDEMSTMRQIGAAPLYEPMAVDAMVSSIARDDPWQAPGYFMILAGWGRLVGWSPLALRLLSLFAGLVALSVTFNLVKRHFSAQVGIYAIFAMGIGAIYLNFLHDMRTYALIVLFVVLLLWAYEQVTTRQRVSLWHYLALGLSTAILLYLHYFAAFAVAGLGVYHAIFRFRKPRYWPTILSLALGGISFLPWVSVLLHGLALTVDNPRRSLNMTPIELTSNMLALFANGNLALMLILGILALRTRTAAVRFVWVWLVGSTALAIIASRFFPALHDIRYLLFLWPGLAVVAGLGIGQLQRMGFPPVIFLSIWFVVFAIQVDSDGPLRDLVGSNFRPPFDNLARQLEGHTQDIDTLMYHLPENAPNDTMHPELLHYYTASQTLKNRVLIPDTTATTDMLYASYVSDAVANAPRVWLAYERSRRNWRIGRVTEEFLPQTGFLYCGSLSERDQPVHVELWSRPQMIDAEHTFTLQSSDGHEVIVDVMQTPVVVKDNQLLVGLLWTLGESTPSSAYSLGVYVFNEENQLVTQFDRGLNTGQGCLLQETSLLSLPEGSYHVYLAVYDWQTGVRLDPVDQEHDNGLVGLGQIRAARFR